jgi:hypothetical protein
MAPDAKKLHALVSEYSRLAQKFRALTDQISKVPFQSFAKCIDGNDRIEFRFLGKKYCLALDFLFDSGDRLQGRLLLLPKEFPGEREYCESSAVWLGIRGTGEVYDADDQNWSVTVQESPLEGDAAAQRLFIRLFDKLAQKEVRLKPSTPLVTGSEP